MLKKPSEFFKKRDTSTTVNEAVQKVVEPSELNTFSDAFVAFKNNLQKIETLSTFSETLESYKTNVEKVNRVSEAVKDIQNEIKNLLKKEDLENAIMSQLILIETTVNDLESKIHGINKKDLTEIREEIIDLSNVFDNFVENELPKYEQLFEDTKFKTDEKCQKLEIEVVRNEQHLKNQNIFIEKIQEEVKDTLSRINLEEIERQNRRLTKKIKYIEEVFEKFDEKQFLNESILTIPPSENNEDPLTPLDQNYVTLDQLNNHYKIFINRIQQQLSTFGGGGETKLKYLDDIVGIATNPSFYDGKFLKYDHSSEQFVFETVVGGGGGLYAVSAGIATYASLAGLSTFSENAFFSTNALYSSSAGVATYSSLSGLSTFSENSTFSTNSLYASSAGVSTYSSLAGLSTFSENSTFSTNALYASSAGVATYSNLSGLSTFSDNATFATNALYSSSSGVSTYSSLAGLSTFSENSTFSTNSLYASSAGIATYSSLSGLSTFSENSTFSTNALYASSSGISSYSNLAGLSTFSDNSSFSTNALYSSSSGVSTYSSLSGLSTFSDSSFFATNALYASSSGVSTYASLSGLSTISNLSNLSQGLTGTPDITIGIVTSTISLPTQLRTKSVAEKTVISTGNTVSLVFNTGGGNVAICTNPTGDITLNVTGIPTDSSFDNHSISFSVIVQQTGTARTCTAVTLNGVTETIRWAGGSLVNAISGVTTSNGYDIFTFTGINTIGSASTTTNYVVLGSVNGGFN